MASSSAFSTDTAANRSNTPCSGLPTPPLPASTTPVTGHPLEATPPPPPMFSFTFSHRHNQLCRMEQLRREQQAWLYRFAAASLFLLILMGCLLFSLWLFLSPRLPQVHLASVEISPVSTAAANVSAACNVSVLFTNPNSEFTIFYDNLEVFVGYKPHKVPLFKVQVPPFSQPQKEHTRLRAHMEISGAIVGNDVVKALKGDLVRGSVSFGVKVYAMIRIESKKWKTSSRVITVNCDDVIVGFSSVNGQGNSLNPYKECQVDL